MTPPLRWYFDILSPFSYLQWPRVRALVDSHAATPVPILFVVVLDKIGQKGPAEIPRKRESMYRHVIWQARRAGIPMTFPPTHPFNPLPALRLVVAAGATPDAIDAVFDWIWAQGRAADSVDALAPLIAQLGLTPDALATDAVKSRLRDNTDAALAAGVFGVPTLAVGDTLFWGNDAHDFALDVLRDPTLLDDDEMQRATRLPIGAQRH